jgi:hypothetical protein
MLAYVVAAVSFVLTGLVIIILCADLMPTWFVEWQRQTRNRALLMVGMFLIALAVASLSFQIDSKGG